ncbi:MAG: hypothetical protein ACRC0G_15765 [Fusobacteriaceae bacterium]
MKTLIVEDRVITLKKKTVIEKIMNREDALEFFDIFIKEYAGLDEYDFIMDEEDFVDLVLSNYSIESEKAFVKLSNAYVARRGTLVGYMIGVLCQLNYKATELIKLTNSELFEVFTLTIYNTVCQTKPEVARNIAKDIVKFGITEGTANIYIENGIPENSGDGKTEKSEPRVTTEEEDIRQLFKELK